MLAATTEFLAGMTEKLRAPLMVRVIWDQISTSAAGTATNTLSACHILSRPAQLFDPTEALAPYATLERGRWPLDGTRALLPDVIPAADQIGLWSEELSDETGALAIPAILTITFSQSISQVGLTLRFDEAHNGYAAQYIIEAYKSGVLQHTETIINDRVESIWENPLDNIDKLVLRFTHWNLPGQRVRIHRLIFGIIRTFENRDLIELSCLRQIDISRATNPAGELRFSIDNRDAAYDPHNPRGIFAYVENKQLTRAYIGFQSDAEHLIPLGIYYPVERSVADGKATFRCLDALSLLDADFPETQYSGQTLYYVAQQALYCAGVTQYVLHDGLNNLTTDALIKNKTCRDILADIALAARLFLYTRQEDGMLILGDAPFQQTNYTLSYDNSAVPDIVVADKIKKLTVEYTNGSVSVILNDAGRDRKISGNVFITSQTQADQIIAWLTPLITRTKTLHNHWRQNPALQCGDLISVSTRFGDLPASVISQRWVFQGGGMAGDTQSLLY